jgi:hypothetical protein
MQWLVRSLGVVQSEHYFDNRYNTNFRVFENIRYNIGLAQGQWTPWNLDLCFLMNLPIIKEGLFYFRAMAFSGHISWQQKQVMHVSASTRGIFSSIVRADTGH